MNEQMNGCEQFEHWFSIGAQFCPQESPAPENESSFYVAPILTSWCEQGADGLQGSVFSDRGDVVLRGFEDPVWLYEVRWREEG